MIFALNYRKYGADTRTLPLKRVSMNWKRIVSFSGDHWTCVFGKVNQQLSGKLWLKDVTSSLLKVHISTGDVKGKKKSRSKKQLKRKDKNCVWDRGKGDAAA